MLDPVHLTFQKIHTGINPNSTTTKIKQKKEQGENQNNNNHWKLGSLQKTVEHKRKTGITAERECIKPWELWPPV